MGWGWALPPLPPGVGPTTLLGGGEVVFSVSCLSWPELASYTGDTLGAGCVTRLRSPGHCVATGEQQHCHNLVTSKLSELQVTFHEFGQWGRVFGDKQTKLCENNPQYVGGSEQKWGLTVAQFHWVWILVIFRWSLSAGWPRLRLITVSSPSTLGASESEWLWVYEFLWLRD